MSIDSERLVSELLNAVSVRNAQLAIKDVPEGFDLPLDKLMERFVEDSRDLVAHGEAGVALENILNNLYEVDFRITGDMLRLSRDAVNACGLDWSEWKFIEELVI